jgi:hypothetical protein
MGNAILLRLRANAATRDHCSEPSNVNPSGIVLAFQLPTGRVEPTDRRRRRQPVSTKEPSEILGVPIIPLRTSVRRSILNPLKERRSVAGVPDRVADQVVPFRRRGYIRASMRTLEST